MWNAMKRVIDDAAKHLKANVTTLLCVGYNKFFTFKKGKKYGETNESKKLFVPAVIFTVALVAMIANVVISGIAKKPVITE